VIRIFSLIVIVFTLLFSVSVFAKVTATVDRAIIEQGETFTLTIKSDNESPELEVLERDFEILGTSQSSKVSFVNGKVSSEKEWIISLSPKKNGVSIIPPIVAGNERTQAIRIQVVKSTAVSATQGADIFLEVLLDTNSAYVQSEVIYTARLFRAVEIRDGSLTEPEIASAVVERMGEDVTYQAMRNQRRYQVTERRFAIFPQKSGNLAIPPTIFEGKVFVPRKVQPGRAMDPFDQFFQSQQRLRRVKVKSDAVVLEVLPQPPSFKGENWLPAKYLVLSESWSKNPLVFKVGEPITRTLRIEAKGQTGAQLPEFRLVNTDGIKQYVDQPTVKTGLSDGSLLGVREEKFAIIPTQSGELQLPEIRLYWWDTVLDKEQVVTIASRTINVVADENVGTGNTQNTKLTETPSSPEDGVNPEMVEAGGAPVGDLTTNQNSQIIGRLMAFSYWPFVALALGVGWLLTIIGWLYQAKRPSLAQQPVETALLIDTVSLDQARKQLKTACEQNDANKAKDALLAWANAAWPGDSKTRSLISVGKRLQDKEAMQAINNLDKILYAGVAYSWDGAKFWKALGSVLKKPRNTSDSKLKSLPGLYPQQQS